MQLDTLSNSNELYQQLTAKRIALMARHNLMTRELLALDVQIHALKPRKARREK
jgi:hypothetical protein